MRQAVVARVLTKDGGVGEVFEEVGLSLIDEVETKTRAIARSSLPVRAVVVFCLAHPGIESRGKKSDGIDGVLGEEKEFVFECESAQACAGYVVRLMQGFALKASAECPNDFC